MSKRARFAARKPLNVACRNIKATDCPHALDAEHGVDDLRGKPGRLESLSQLLGRSLNEREGLAGSLGQDGRPLRTCECSRTGTLIDRAVMSALGCKKASRRSSQIIAGDEIDGCRGG